LVAVVLVRTLLALLATVELVCLVFFGKMDSFFRDPTA